MDLTRYVERARKGVITGRSIRYQLGQGGYDPARVKPSQSGLCDCAGFVAWVLGRSRRPSKAWPWWLSSSSVWSDAAPGKQVVFVALDHPVPGCIAAYPDYRSGGRLRQGHLAVVVDPAAKTIIDCGQSSNGIRERSGAFFWRVAKDRPEVRWIALRSDVEAAAEKVD